MPSSPAARSSAKRLEMRVELGAEAIIGLARLKQAFIGVHVLIAAAGEIDDDEIGRLELGEALDEAGQRVRGLEGRDDAFGAREEFCGFECSRIGNSGIFGAMLIGEPGVFRTNGRIIETRGNGMGGGDLAIFVLQDVGVGALQNARASASEALVGGEACGVLAKPVAAAASLDTDHFYAGILEEFVEETNGVGAATNTGVKMRGQALFGSEDLFAGFAANDGLEIADHGGVRMRAKNGAKEIMGIADVGDPIAHGFVDGVFEGFAAGFDADDFRAEHAHAGNVEGLARHIFGAHVNSALQAEMRSDSGGGDTMLACAGFGDDAWLAHLYSEKALADGVIYFVGAGVQQIFALQVDARAAEFGGETGSKLQRRGTSGEVFQKVLKFSLKRRIGFRLFVGALQFVERHHQRFRNIAAAIGAETPGNGSGNGELRGHGLSVLFYLGRGEFQQAFEVESRFLASLGMTIFSQLGERFRRFRGKRGRLRRRRREA
jgi:hypothetical protein